MELTKRRIIATMVQVFMFSVGFLLFASVLILVVTSPSIIAYYSGNVWWNALYFITIPIGFCVFVAIENAIVGDN